MRVAVTTLTAIAVLLPVAPGGAQTASLGWPEVIALLTKTLTQATTCVQVLKSNGDKAAVAKAQ